MVLWPRTASRTLSNLAVEPVPKLVGVTPMLCSPSLAYTSILQAEPHPPPLWPMRTPICPGEDWTICFVWGQNNQKAYLARLISFFKQQKINIRKKKKKKRVWRVESKVDEGYKYAYSSQSMVYLNNVARILKIQSWSFKCHLWIYIWMS